MVSNLNIIKIKELYRLCFLVSFTVNIESGLVLYKLIVSRFGSVDAGEVEHLILATLYIVRAKSEQSHTWKYSTTKYSNYAVSAQAWHSRSSDPFPCISLFSSFVIDILLIKYGHQHTWYFMKLNASIQVPMRQKESKVEKYKLTNSLYKLKCMSL